MGDYYMHYINLNALRETPLTCDPFEFIIVPPFISPEGMESLLRDFPKLSGPGSYPISEVTYGPRFAELLDDLNSEEFAVAVGEKFSVNLLDYPRIITVRGRASLKDGKIHTDAVWKIITVLIYLNDGWEPEGGRLRLLKSKNLDDFAAEVPPEFGTLLAFKRCDHSFHGHKPFEGVRRVVQLNWVNSIKKAESELSRHRWTKRLRRLLPFLPRRGY